MKTLVSLPNGRHFVAAEVLAGAYRGRDIDDRTLLAHTIELDETGDTIRVLCRTVKPDNLTTGSCPPDREPTCPRCQERLAAIRSRSSYGT